RGRGGDPGRGRVRGAAPAEPAGGSRGGLEWDVSCVLRAIGQEFDPAAFLEQSDLPGATAFHRGDADIPGALGSRRRTASGFNVTVSRAGFDDLDAQIRDAVRFLRLHEDELRRLSG